MHQINKFILPLVDILILHIRTKSSFEKYLYSFLIYKYISSWNPNFSKLFATMVHWWVCLLLIVLALYFMPIHFTQLLEVLFHPMHRSIHPSIHVFSLHVEPLVPLCFHRISYIRYLLLSSTLLPEYLYFSPIPVFIYIRGEATKEIIWVIILKTILTYFNITMSQLITIWYGDNQSCIKI